MTVSVAFKEKQADEPPKTEKAPAAADKGKGAKGGKGGKDKGGKDKDGKGSRPPSQQFDIGKPHWTLRVVSDASCSVSMAWVLEFSFPLSIQPDLIHFNSLLDLIIEGFG